MKKLIAVLLALSFTQAAHASCVSVGSASICATPGISVPGLAFTDVKSLSINGTSQSASGGNASSLDIEGTHAMWLGAWIYISSWHPSTDFGKHDILGKVMHSTSGVSPHVGYELRATYDNSGYFGRAAFYIASEFDGGGHNYMGVTTADYSLPLHTWLRLDAVNVDGTAANAKIYLNCVDVTSTIESDTLSGSIKTSASFSIGSRNGVENFFSGRINDPIVADFAPTQADINKVCGIAPTNASILTFSNPILSSWWNGDLDSGTTIKDHSGTVPLTLTNSPSFVTDTQSTAYSATPGWTPSSATDGTVNLWLDATDNAVITQTSGSVSRWTDKSSHGYTYSASSHKPTVGTCSNGKQCLVSDGTQYLTMDAPARIIPNSHTRYLLLAIFEVTSVTSSPANFPGIWIDGEGTGQTLKLGASDFTASGNYTDVWYGAQSGFATVRWNFGMTPPQLVSMLIENDGGNTTSSFVTTVGGALVTTNTAGSFSSETDGGGVFSLGSQYIAHAKIEEIVEITDFSAKDKVNLEAFRQLH